MCSFLDVSPVSRLSLLVSDHSRHPTSYPPAFTPHKTHYCEPSPHKGHYCQPKPQAKLGKTHTHCRSRNFGTPPSPIHSRFRTVAKSLTRRTLSMTCNHAFMQSIMQILNTLPLEIRSATQYQFRSMFISLITSHAFTDAFHPPSVYTSFRSFFSYIYAVFCSQSWGDSFSAGKCESPR